MKIVIVCKSHTLGGAAVVSHRLMNALRAIGHDARMLVLSSPDDVNVANYSAGWRTKVDFLAERLQIFLQNGFSKRNLFKVDTASWGADISKHPWVVEADVVNINWINQGAMSLGSIAHLAASGKKIVWTMHDMWNCTGICHHAYSCNHYLDHCGNCPYLGFMAHSSDLSAITHKKKAALYASTDIHFVAVSTWLADRCRSSSLMKDAKISVIPNAFPVHQYTFHRGDNSRYGIAADKKVLAMGAARLDDEVKGFDVLIRATQYIAENMPEVAKQCHLLLYGGIRDKSLLSSLALPYTYLGIVDGKEVSSIFSHADVVLSTSHYETLPGTIIEGIASGCLSVSFSCGGFPDIVDHMKCGYLATPGDVADFAKGVKWALNNQNVNRESLYQDMKQRFSAESVAQRYVELIENM